MDEIGTILPSLFRSEIRRAEPHLLDILLPLWPRIAGRIIAQHSQPTFFASGVLTLATDCAAWDTQLRQMAEEVRAKINGVLGQTVVRKLRINKKMAQPSLFSAPRRRARGTVAPVLPRPERAARTDCIDDAEIAAALASSYAKYFNRPGRS